MQDRNDLLNQARWKREAAEDARRYAAAKALDDARDAARKTLHRAMLCMYLRCKAETGMITAGPGSKVHLNRFDARLGYYASRSEHRQAIGGILRLLWLRSSMPNAPISYPAPRVPSACRRDADGIATA